MFKVCSFKCNFCHYNLEMQNAEFSDRAHALGDDLTAAEARAEAWERRTAGLYKLKSVDP